MGVFSAPSMYVYSRDMTQISELSSKHLYPLGHLVSLTTQILFFCKGGFFFWGGGFKDRVSLCIPGSLETRLASNSRICLALPMECITRPGLNFYFMCMGIWSVYMFVYHLHTVSEKARRVGSSGTKLETVVCHHVDAENQTSSSARVMSAFNH